MLWNCCVFLFFFCLFFGLFSLFVLLHCVVVKKKNNNLTVKIFALRSLKNKQCSVVSPMYFWTNKSVQLRLRSHLCSLHSCKNKSKKVTVFQVMSACQVELDMEQRPAIFVACMCTLVQRSGRSVRIWSREVGEIQTLEAGLQEDFKAQP